jgi:hypothetical protein
LSSKGAAKSLVAALIACLLPIPTMAQLRTPENVPIAFYGKVVDQNGQSVGGAKVSLLVVVSHVEQYDTETRPVTLETDENGNFTLSGYTAYAIDKIAVEKKGYGLSKKTTLSYVFGGTPTYAPDPNNPVVFKMWKSAGKERLTSSSWQGNVACDGTTRHFDLLTGHPNPGGNLEIMCLRDPLQLPHHTNTAFDYSFRVVIVGGSIKPTDDEFSYLAPKGGYAENFVIQHKASDTNWTPKVKQEFYIKTAEGDYGRLWVDWYSTQKSPTHLDWNCSINPTGSRNLER